MIYKAALALALLGCLVDGVTISKDVNDIKFYYYASPSDRREIIHGNVASLSASGIRSGTKTTVLIDGFMSDSTSPMSTKLRDALLASKPSENMIVVDWGRLAGSGLTLGNLIETGSAYVTVLGNVGPVGGRVADFLEFLRANRNIDQSQVYIIGHSLGAHIAGACGVFSQNRYGKTVNRISGLDPAGPFFSLQVDKDKRLHKGDAGFIDIYHTNRGTLGDSDHQTGDINVYVNGGDKQPGCAEADSSGFAGYCSHSYSWQLFEQTIRRDIKACPCTGLACQCNSNCNTQCSNPISIGAKTPTSARAAYHLINSDVYFQ